MNKISKLYIPLIREFRIVDLAQFVDTFYRRMSQSNFFGILRAYGIVPLQHRIKWVTEALKLMKSSTKEPLTKKRSTSYLSAISEKLALIDRRLIVKRKDKAHWERCLENEKETIHPDREEKIRRKIRSLDNKIKELERSKSGIQLGI